MKIIGSSINEAIDWTQDILSTTRPLAERTLFSLMEDALVEETEDGYAFKTEHEDDVQKHLNKANGLHHNPRFRFHSARAKSTGVKAVKGYHMNSSLAAEAMMANYHGTDNAIKEEERIEILLPHLARNHKRR